MSKRRFVAPLRGEVAAQVFDHPIYAGLRAHEAWLRARAWPSLAMLDTALQARAERSGFAMPRCVAQDETLLREGLHYERRIGERGELATRAENWHDFFNALVWCEQPAIKRAINLRQMAAIAEVGERQRNRAQYALTQFDEAGVIVRVRAAAALSMWDAHDWQGLFFRERDAWRSGDIAVIAVIGHALLEHALVPELHAVGKALVVKGEGDDAACIARVARAIGAGEVLNDPLELRPLPLSGIPGWRALQDEAFYRSTPCFQPVREGRVYPPPL